MYSPLFLYNDYKRKGKYGGMVALHGGVFLCEAFIPNCQLWMISGTIPALVRAGGAGTRGELWLAPEKLLKKFDMFDLVRSGQFERELSHVNPLGFFEVGDPFLAEVYIWKSSLPAGSQKIIGGIINASTL